SPSTNPRASSASREGIPRASAASARPRTSPVWASATATTAAIPSKRRTGGRSVRIAAAALGVQAGAPPLHPRRARPPHLGEPAAFVAELDYVLSRHRPDPVDRFELLDRGAAKADRPFFGAGAGGHGRTASRGQLRDEHLLPIAETGGEVDRFQLRPCAGAT